MSGSQYRPDRRAEPVPRVHRVEKSDAAIPPELKFDATFKAAMERAADALKAERDRKARHGRTFSVTGSKRGSK